MEYRFYHVLGSGQLGAVVWNIDFTKSFEAVNGVKSSSIWHKNVMEVFVEASMPRNFTSSLVCVVLASLHF